MMRSASSSSAAGRVSGEAALNIAALRYSCLRLGDAARFGEGIEAVDLGPHREVDRPVAQLLPLELLGERAQRAEHDGGLRLVPSIAFASAWPACRQYSCTRVQIRFSCAREPLAERTDAR